MEFLTKKVSKRDIRALKIGAVATAAVFLFVITSSWLENWWSIRETLLQKRAELNNLVASKIKHAGLLSIVPVFEMPRAEEEQKFLFRDSLRKQLKKAGLKTSPLVILDGKKDTGIPAYELLCVKCSSKKCKLSQILDLLAVLKENPHLAGIEELRIKCNPKKRDEFELDMVVSTFVK